jgi:hypothetical protein
MIPTLILFGILCGRWWRAVLLAAAVGWPLLLLATGSAGLGPGQLVGAAALAVANTALGVLVHRGVWRLVRKARRAD